MTTALSITSTVTLQNKPPTKQPRLGWGSWPSKSETCTRSVLTALSLGYRHVDSAQGYKNEKAIGNAVKTTEIPRSELYITSKILCEAPFDEQKVYDGIVESVKKLNGGREGGYTDLFLIHGAALDGGKWNKIQWRALERAYKDGLTKAIGVSNAGKAHIEALKDGATVWPPHVNQIELHPWCQQNEAVAWCHSQGMVVQAYSPLVRNKHADNPTLKAVAAKYKKSTAQILIRYALQKVWIPLPKSDDPGRIKENADVYDFEISNEDMEKLNALEEGPGAALDEDAWAVAGRETSRV